MSGIVYHDRPVWIDVTCYCTEPRQEVFNNPEDHAILQLVEQIFIEYTEIHPCFYPKTSEAAKEWIENPSNETILTKVQTLDLAELELQVLPPQIEKLKNLEELNLGENLLQQLPPEIGNLSKLELLNCQGNPLTKIPPEIGSLKCLKQLYLSENSLIFIPPEIWDLPDVEITS